MCTLNPNHLARLSLQAQLLSQLSKSLTIVSLGIGTSALCISTTHINHASAAHTQSDHFGENVSQVGDILLPPPAPPPSPPPPPRPPTSSSLLLTPVDNSAAAMPLTLPHLLPPPPQGLWSSTVPAPLATLRPHSTASLNPTPLSTHSSRVLPKPGSQ